MKNGLLVWNVLLTIAAGFLLITHFTKKKDGPIARDWKQDSLSVGRPFRLAYFEMDSVQANAYMVKDVQAEIEKREKEYSGQLSQYEAAYRNKLQEYQQKERGGTMTQADYEKAQLDLKQLEDRLKGKRQELDQQYQDFVMRSQLNLKKAIEEFISEYNKEKQYTYIVSYEQGLFYYKDTVFNITADLVKGLNQQYKAKKN
jgi:Outer membrane protein